MRRISCGSHCGWGFPRSIDIYRVEPVDDDFQARFSATGKRYIYYYHEGQADPFQLRWCWSIGNRQLDVARMNEGARHLIGCHDFSAFTANPHDKRLEQTVKDVRRLEIMRDGPRIELITEADGYLFRMVRSIAGCLFDVGIGKIAPDEVARIRDSRIRTSLVQTASAEGLFLDEVFY